MAAWKSIWNSVRSGDFNAAGNYLFLDQETVDRSNNADSQLEAIVKDDYARATIDSEQYNETMSRIQGSAFDAVFGNKDQAPLDAFKQGAVEGLNNTMKLSQGVIGGLASILPWQLYAIGFIFLVVWFAPMAIPNVVKGLISKAKTR